MQDTDQLIMYPSKLKLVVFLLPLVVLELFSISIIKDGNLAGWGLTVVVFIAMVMLVAMYFPGSSHLRLTSNGFELTGTHVQEYL